MTSQFDSQKKELRAWARRQRAEFLSLDAPSLTNHLTQLANVFNAQIACHAWKHVAVFIPLPGEPDIWMPSITLFDSGDIQIYAPRMMPDNHLDLVAIQEPSGLVRGPFGVIQPPQYWDALTDLALLDAIFIPGLAFSPDGGRLGFGGGWYDRLLERIPADTMKIGVCWSQMLFESIPLDTWDIKVDAILTEVGFVKTLGQHNP